MPYKHLSTDERNVIYTMTILGKSRAQIARCLGRHPSTISREQKRNTNCDGRYLPQIADIQARLRRRAHIRRPKIGNGRLMAHVEDKLRCRWSPQQIAGRLREAPPRAFDGATISHTTIYRWIWACPERAQRFKPYLRVAWKNAENPTESPLNAGRFRIA